MVGSEGIGKGLESQEAGSAAQALSAILQTHYLRYMIIASWALGLIATVGLPHGLLWFAGTLAAGALRGVAEKRISESQDAEAGWGRIFPIVGAVTTAAWAVAPLLAWFSPSYFGRELAIAFLISGYVLVFAQLRSSPKQALIISSPYGLAAAIIGVTLIGHPDAFWPFVALIPVTVASLFVLVTMTMLREDRIRAFQEHQAHLIAELEAARDKADAANEAKSNFLGVISHELRTPMNGVLGVAQLLSATRLDGAQREYLAIIRNSGDNLLSLLNDILDMTKIEAGRMNFESIDIQLDDLHRRIVGPFEAQAEAKGLTFVSEFEGEMPAVVRGDPLRVCQVVQNLLSNAVKFTDGGDIRLVTRGRRISERRVAFEFAVYDSGAGISEADMDQLFQPFTQIDASSTRRFGGTGLGLTISRRLANIMGGDISVTSEVGKGSVFVFAVEGEVVHWVDETAEVDADAEMTQEDAMEVLVVEDHAVNRMILEAWMGSTGRRTTTAENGQEAVEIARHQTFDLIVMDVNMPIMDGLTATRLIREGGANAETPIVVLSASARNEDQEAGLAAGADAYLNKPIDFRSLAGLMSQAKGGRSMLRRMIESEAA
ncbi:MULTISPECIES: response regulator [Brevundimonas]|uniref:response regulator n=1 Tax=Brevundimonas TaxID=41275 RepID=UPI001902E78E|nr:MULTISPECIES: response regulator [Brevundimonas]MBK1968016.1 response regulator [Brevundimonas diminuta]MBK1974666.1 response regulator [Brevundimonas diminuta]MDA0742219.1 response regulator [Pseudomonadota bacterium]MDM8351378.1 response regulator [Brevundimonas diminuta]